MASALVTGLLFSPMAWTLFNSQATTHTSTDEDTGRIKIGYEVNAGQAIRDRMKSIPANPLKAVIQPS